MDRREFSRIIAVTTVSTLLRAPAFALQATTGSTGAEPGIDPKAAELYRQALVLDCNSGPPDSDTFPLTQSDLDMVRNSGVNVVKLTLGGINSNFADTVKQLGDVHKLIEVHPEYFMQVRLAADIEQANRENKMGIIFSFESAEMLEGKLDRIEIFRNLGVRVMQLSYNRKSPFAAGVMEPEGGGLTPLGREAIAKMNALGIAIDLSHANPQTTSDAIVASSKTVIMTHGGCAAVHAHPRNKTDQQLRALADKGGVFGIYDLPYLTASPKQPAVDDYMAHMEHALKVMGEDHVGVGSDAGISPWDTSPKATAQFNQYMEERKKTGLAAPEEDRPMYVIGMNGPNKIEVITDQLLRRGYPSRVAEKIIGRNFARVLNEIWTA